MRKRSSSPSAHRGVASPASIVALEKRIAFDGAAAGVAAKALHVEIAHAPSVEFARETVAVAHREVPTVQAPRTDLTGVAQALRGLDTGAQPSVTPRSVVFIESDVPDVPTLIKDIDHSAQIVLLDPSRNGVDAIASYLAAHKGVQNVYIFSHGSQAQLDLGTSVLTSASMQGRYAGDLASIKASLAPGANILVYGCDFAQGTRGDGAAHLLSRLTGAAVAGSTDLTGGTAQGGNFVLEDHVGTITAPNVLSARIAADYAGLLAAPTTIFANSGTGAYKGNLEFLTFANTSLATNGITDGATATYATAEGGTVTVTFHVSSANAANAATYVPAPLSAYAPSKFASGYDNTSSTTAQLYGGSFQGTVEFTITFSAIDKNGIAYKPNIAFADGEVTETSEYYTVKTTGGAFQSPELEGSPGYALTGLGTQSFTLQNDAAGVPLITTTGVTTLDITNMIAGGKEGFAIALVEPTLSLDQNGSSGAAAGNFQTRYTEKGGAVAISDVDTSAVEPGVANASGATIVLTNAQAGDALSVGALPSGITSTIDTSRAGQVTVTLSGASSLANYDKAIRAIAFSNSSGNPSTVDRSVAVTFNDGSQTSNTAVSTIHVTAVNDSPVETTPAAQFTSKNTALTISGLSVSDVDANGSAETTTLSVADGTITLASTTGLTFSRGTGTNEATETFTGTLDAINNAIATITYQPTTGIVGSDTLTFSTNDNGNTGSGGPITASRTVAITIDSGGPVANGTIANQTYTDGQRTVTLATSQAFTNRSGSTLTYSAAGLPSGLTIDAGTGQISGTLDHDASANAPVGTGSGATLDGTYTVMETASDGQGGSATQVFTIDTTNQAPVVGTKTVSQSNNDGDAIAPVDAAAAFSDPNGDPLTFTATSLPPGLTISSTGSITGTVAGNAAPGTYAVVVTATDDKGAATAETFSWAIADVPPAKAATLANQVTIDGQAGISISTSQGFTDANGNSLTYSATGLPAGLSIDAATGRVTGTIDHDASKNAPVRSGAGATLDGTYTVVVTASDGLGGSATQSFTIDLTNGAPVVGTNTTDQTTSTGVRVTPVDASKAFSDPNGDPLTFAASNLPSGLSIDPTTGVISGTVAANATPMSYAVRVLATDDKGAAASETFAWRVNDTPPTPNGSIANQTVADSTANIAIATSGAFSNPNGLALTYTASGLPLGLSIDPATGTISGQLDHDASKNAPATSGSGATLDGTYTVTVVASDGQGGMATQVFRFDATNNAPTLVNQTPDQTGADGQAVSLDGAKPFQDRNVGDTFTYTASGLPTGLSIDAGTGLITGTIDPHASRSGPFTTVVTVTDDKGASTTETFGWAVNDVPPIATPALADRAVNDGTAVTIATASGFTNPNNVAYTYSASNLPKGLAIDANTGVISGTIDHDASVAATGGTYAVAVTANDGQGGSATNSFRLTSSNQAPVVGPMTAARSNLDGDTITPVDATKAFSDPNGDPLTYAASALPAGLAIDPSTGIISGTVSKSAPAGAYAVAVTATDDKGLAATENFTWTIGSVPPQANGTIASQSFADATPGITIVTATAFSDRNGNALTYSATGLPAGLSIDPVTGKITGTLDHDASKNAPITSGSGATLDGTYTIVVTAADGIGGTATQTFTLDATNQAPTVATNTPGQTNTDGDVISVDAGKAFVDPNTGDQVTYAASGLPAGLTIDPRTGLISGTVQNGDYATSPYTVTVVATDDKGAAASESFSWTIKILPTASVSPIPNVASFDGNAVAIDIASHFTKDGVTTFVATGLPKGLSIDPATGAISGMIDHDASINGPNPTGTGRTADSVYAVSVTATNGSGSSAQTFNLDVANQAPVVGTVTANQSHRDGDSIATVDASQAFSDPNSDPLTFSANNLPRGLAIDASTGRITGTVAGNTTPGDYRVSVTATDDKGAATSEVFTWTIADVPPTTNGVLASQKDADGTTGISIATAGGFAPTNGNALTYGATGLPPGLTIDPRTGVISGAIDHDASKNAPTTSGTGATLDGTYTIIVTAYDGLGGSAVQSFAFDATNTAPALTARTADQHGQDRQTVTLATAQNFADANGDPLTFAASNLPAGLAIDPATGLISGTIEKAASVNGPTTVSVTASDDKGATATETFTWTVDDLPPQATQPLADRSLNDGAAVSFATSGGFTNPNAATLTYSASGLPKGLSIDPASGLVSGTLDHDASAAAPGGLYTVAVTVDDGQGGTATSTFHLAAANQAPAVTTPFADKANNDGGTIAPLDASKAFTDPNAGDILSFATTGLPAGLVIDPGTGVISGTVAADAASGHYAVTVTATDDKGAATSEAFAWTVSDVAPSATGLATQHLTDGEGGVAIATAGGFARANGNPFTFAATGLPAGLAIDPATGRITGMLDRAASANAPVKLGTGAAQQGVYAVIVTVTDPYGGTASDVFAIEVGKVPRTVGVTTPDQHGQAGEATVPLDLAAAFAVPAGDALTYAVTGLPPGLAFDPATGRVTGTIASFASPQVYAVTVSATDGSGARATETFLYTVDTVRPSILTPPSFLEPLAALIPTLTSQPTVIADLGSGRRADPVTPVLDVINQTSGDRERSQVIDQNGIVVSTVNAIAPLDALQKLSEPDAGIVRSGAATNERGDRFVRTQEAIGRGIEALSTPSSFLGATSVDVDAAGRTDAPPIAIETMLRDRVLSISVGSGAGPGDRLARMTITRADGRPLPPWLHADGKGFVAGKVPGGVESIDLTITSIFASGTTSQRSVTIHTDRGTITPLAPRPQAGRTLSHLVAAARSTRPDLAHLARLLD